MSTPTLTPVSTLSAVILPVTGSPGDVAGAVPYGIYAKDSIIVGDHGRKADNPLYSQQFLSGAAEQVTYVYRKLGGDVLDIELTPANVYSSYEEAVLEYSYIVNLHQASNMLVSSLGSSTGSFDHRGMLSGSVDGSGVGDDTAVTSSAMNGQNISLKYPRFSFAHFRSIAAGASEAAGLNSSLEFSASFNVEGGIQDYDLQEIIEAKSKDPDNSALDYYDKVKNKKILIKKVFYKTPHAMWRFYGYYGGLNVVGNLHNYGQFSDNSTFELIPAWHNKLQAAAFEDAIYTRMSHFSYEIKNNNLRLFPIPQNFSPKEMYIQFSVPGDPWDAEGYEDGTDGVNNLNTLPLSNIPYDKINSIGKQWIRRFSLALSKEVLGQVRSKFNAVPIPGQTLTMNGSTLITEGRDEQKNLREELKTTLSELTYAKLSEMGASMTENAAKALNQVPLNIFVG